MKFRSKRQQPSRGRLFKYFATVCGLLFFVLSYLHVQLQTTMQTQLWMESESVDDSPMDDQERPQHHQFLSTWKASHDEIVLEESEPEDFRDYGEIQKHELEQPQGKKAVAISRKNVTLLPYTDNRSGLVLDPKDYVYKRGPYDGAPIVVEEYRLIFFTIPKVGCTVFKQLFRRMMHLDNWYVQEEPFLPHHPGRNGLKYLYDYTPKQAHDMMVSPDWTRAIFVRNPKERVLSAYLDKVQHHHGYYVAHHCCGFKKDRRGRLSSPSALLVGGRRNGIGTVRFPRRPNENPQPWPPNRLEDLRPPRREDEDAIRRRRLTTTEQRQRLALRNKNNPGSLVVERSMEEKRKRRENVLSQLLQNRESRVSDALRRRHANKRGKQQDQHPLCQQVVAGQPKSKDATAATQSNMASLLTFTEFLNLTKSCSDPHWLPQADRMEAKYWPFVNFVGHIETAHQDAMALLQRIGAPELAYGWGSEGTSEIFQETKIKHATGADQRLQQYYQDPTVEELVEHVYRYDYDHPVLNLTLEHIG